MCGGAAAEGILFLERFVIEIIYTDTTLWPCEAKCSKAREIGVGQFYWTSNDNLKRKTL